MYYYDYENRLTKITKDPNNTAVAEFSYDALGRRIEKKDSITSANTRRYYNNYNWSVGDGC
jgi:YD repeat-containing protein